ncbi:anthranilate synthase family protein [Streptomyces chryseus]
MTLPSAVPALLARLIAPGAPAFALLHRRTPRVPPGNIEVLLGTVRTYSTLAELPLPTSSPESSVPVHDLLALVPYRQIRERGFDVHDDGTPLQALHVTEQHALPVEALLPLLPQQPVDLEGGRFDSTDAEYGDVVHRILRDEIGQGAGANFVIRRDFTATLRNFSTDLALTLFRRLLEQERGAYWTFLVHTGERVLLGASPEVHVRQSNGTVVMNPISGTYRYPVAGPTLPSVLGFLQDAKEQEELTMVVDEELKMMCSVGDLGGQVIGPRLKEMARLAHTEYELRGRTSMDVRDVLRETMFAATVTGSPLRNAARVIARYEPSGRGYYAGALALIGRSASGGQVLDSPICIRTADIDSATGELVVRVGATLVRHSDPDSEIAETHTKAAAILGALGLPKYSNPTSHAAEGNPTFAENYQVQTALSRRRAKLAPFWLKKQQSLPAAIASTVLIIDCEDTFTSMLAHLLRSLGHPVVVKGCDAPELRQELAVHAGIVLIGPGPGDPTIPDDSKMRVLRDLTVAALARPHGGLLAVCLGHQMLAAELGLTVLRKNSPYQGAQEEIDLFGQRETVGFYNTFTARCSDADAARLRALGVEVARDPWIGDVHALRGPNFASVQFHPESVLSIRGIEIVARLLRGVEVSAGLAPAETGSGR